MDAVVSSTIQFLRSVAPMLEFRHKPLKSGNKQGTFTRLCGRDTIEGAVSNGFSIVKRALCPAGREVCMPRSFVRRFLAAVFAAAIWSVPTDSLAQASAYPVSRSRPFRVVPAGTLLEIDRALKQGAGQRGDRKR